MQILKYRLFRARQVIESVLASWQHGGEFLGEQFQTDEAVDVVRLALFSRSLAYTG